MPEFRPSWAPPILVGAGMVLLWQLLFSVLGASLESGALATLSCCGCCSFPLVLGLPPAFMALRRDPNLQPGEGFAVSFIGVGAGVVLTLAILYLNTPIADLRDGIEEEIRRSIELMKQQQPDLELDEEQRQGAIEFARSVAPYMPLAIGLVVALSCGAVGMISVIFLRGRRRSHQSATSA